jgi:Curli production assembly/transport component CsgG
MGMGAGHVRAQEVTRDVTVAVWDFDLNALDRAKPSGIAQYTRALPELLTQHILSYPGTHVVERSKLREILDEQKLGSSALSDEDTRIRLGRLSGARHMIFGSALSIGPMTRLDVRLVSVETSRIESSFEVSGAPQELPDQMGDLAKDLVNSMMAAALAEATVKGAKNADANANANTNSSKGKPQLAASSTIIPTTATTTTTLALFDTGLAQMDRKDFEGAIETFKTVLAQAPGFAPAERNIRTALEKLSTQ